MRWLLWTGLSLAATGFLAVGALAGGSAPLVAWPRRVAEVMLSPGDVHAKHRDLSCRACHRSPAPGESSAPAGSISQPVGGQGARAVASRVTCLGAGCHEPEKDFGSEATRELHRRRADTPCQSCHPEHRGRAARLTVAFHEATPAADARSCTDCHLAEGRKAHPEIRVERCATCHPSFTDWKEIAFSHRDVSSLACTECHQVPTGDLHGALAPAERGKCESCHGTERWKPAEFRHDALPGGGRGTCDRCHLKAGEKAHPEIGSRRCDVCHVSTGDWKRVSFSHAEVAGQACSSCHRAPNDGVHGALGAAARASCASCHATAGWRPARFSHDLLAGGGRGSCSSCHRAPRSWIHVSAAGVSCSRCHSTSAWEPSTFRHPRVPEFGEHLERFGCKGCHPSGLDSAVPCERCHGRGGFFED